MADIRLIFILSNLMRASHSYLRIPFQLGVLRHLDHESAFNMTSVSLLYWTNLCTTCTSQSYNGDFVLMRTIADLQGYDYLIG